MNITALIAAIAIAVAGASQATPATAHLDECSTAYNALVADLRAGQQPHKEWIVFLQTYPNYPVPPDVNSIESQQSIVSLYEWRIWMTYLLAIGNRSAAWPLIENFNEHMLL